MPHYFFDVRDGDRLHRDEVGIELPHMESAIAEAHRTLAEMSAEAISDVEIEILIRDHGEGPVRVTLSTSTERPGGA